MEKNTEIETVVETISENYSFLTSECKNELKHCCRIVYLDKLSVIIREGQLTDKLYFIVSGCLRAFYHREDKQITDWFAFEGDFMSSINGFHQSLTSKHNIELLEPTTFLEISREAIFNLSEKHHCFERLGRIVVTKKMLQLQQRIVSIQFETAKQKYESLVNMRPDIIQRVPLTHIASHLGITLETLSRIRNPKNGI
jgi:CRP-like cAMP-binding protein